MPASRSLPSPQLGRRYLSTLALIRYLWLTGGIDDEDAGAHARVKRWREELEHLRAEIAATPVTSVGHMVDRLIVIGTTATLGTAIGAPSASGQCWPGRSRRPA